MLRVTAASHEMAVAVAAKAAEGVVEERAAVEPGDWENAEISGPPDQTRQFLTLYEALQGFDDRAAQARITCPRLCFAGSADEIQYGPKWGDALVSIAGPLLSERVELERLGWEVRVLEGMDHLQAMQAAQVLPILRPWLASHTSFQPSPIAPGHE